jgi:hypothetical protein
LPRLDGILAIELAAPLTSMIPRAPRRLDGGSALSASRRGLERIRRCATPWWSFDLLEASGARPDPPFRCAGGSTPAGRSGRRGGSTLHRAQLLDALRTQSLMNGGVVGTDVTPLETIRQFAEDQLAS